jgi:hypothetical protein
VRVIGSSVGSPGVQAREEAAAGRGSVLGVPYRLEVASEVEQEAGKLWTPLEVQLLESAPILFPERALCAGAMLGRPKAPFHAADAGVHAARLAAKAESEIGKLAYSAQ